MATSERTREQPSQRVLSWGWSVLVGGTALVLGFVLPYRLVTLADPALTWSAEAWVTAVFVADFALRARRARGSSLGRQRAWLAVDLVAALPWASLLQAPAAGLLRLVKLLRAAPILGGFGLGMRLNPTLTRMSGFLFALVQLAHWLACGWMALDGPAPGGALEAGYLDALYATVTTLTTVGYGDVTPITAPQKTYAMIMMGLGVGVYGFVIGNVATLLTRVDMARAQYVATLDRLSGFLRYRRVPVDVQHQIFGYYRYLWEHRMGYDEGALLADLPPSLRRELSLVLKGDLVEKSSLLDGASKELVLDLCAELEPSVVPPGDVIVRAGDVGHHMYFISAGEVEVLASDGRRIRTLGEGACFGELALLRSQPRTATVRALEYCDVYTLGRDAFARTIDRHPEFAERIRELATRHDDLGS